VRLAAAEILPLVPAILIRLISSAPIRIVDEVRAEAGIHLSAMPAMVRFLCHKDPLSSWSGIAVLMSGKMTIAVGRGISPQAMVTAEGGSLAHAVALGDLRER